MKCITYSFPDFMTFYFLTHTPTILSLNMSGSHSFLVGFRCRFDRVKGCSLPYKYTETPLRERVESFTLVTYLLANPQATCCAPPCLHRLHGPLGPSVWWQLQPAPSLSWDWSTHGPETGLSDGREPHSRVLSPNFHVAVITRMQ